MTFWSFLVQLENVNFVVVSELACYVGVVRKSATEIVFSFLSCDTIESMLVVVESKHYKIWVLALVMVRGVLVLLRWVLESQI